MHLVRCPQKTLAVLRQRRFRTADYRKRLRRCLAALHLEASCSSPMPVCNAGTGQTPRRRGRRAAAKSREWKSTASHTAPSRPKSSARTPQSPALSTQYFGRASDARSLAHRAQRRATAKKQGASISRLHSPSRAKWKCEGCFPAFIIDAGSRSHADLPGIPCCCLVV